MNKDENINLQEENSAENKVNEQVSSEELQDEPKLDVDALSCEEAKNVLKEVLESNTELVKELSSANAALTAAKEEAASNKDKWYRSVAEFENFKKRNADTRKNAYFDGKKDVVTSILVIGDSIARALSIDMDEKTREGVMLIERQFSDTLAALGVEEINPVGEMFNPETSEAIHTVSCTDGEKENIVKTVFKKGYRSDGKMIRYCQVVVTQNN